MSSVSEGAPGLVSVLDGVPSAMVQWNRMGRVTAWNRAATRLFGFSREEALGAHVDRFLAPAYRGVLTKVWQEFEGHSECSVHCQILTVGGESVPTEWHSIALTAPDGSVDRASTSVTVSHGGPRSDAEGGGALSLLASGVAHEFMNVFAVILSHAKFIEAASHGDPRQGDANEIVKSAATGACLTRHLLSISGLGSNHGRLDVNATVQAMAAAITSAMGGAFELVVTTGDEAVVDMDWAEFDRMLLDLVLAARRRMPRVERLRISTERTVRSEGGSLVRISVAPQGPEGEAPLPVRGAEFDCSEAKRIAESAEGTMGVRGAELFVELPCSGPAEETSSSGIGRGAQPPAAELKDTVFVLEDEDSVREALVRVLELAGYEVRASGSVASARAELESGLVPDLIVCDLSLHDGSSTKLLEWLRRERPAVYERAIVLTGGAITTADRSYLRRNALRVLNKPVGPGSLLSALADARARGGQPLRRGETHRPESARVSAKEGLP
ncbi:MAG TPA: response regulator [Polyangiaceae bacterium]|nr:response regulator [Polyangiaceae bacterium]